MLKALLATSFCFAPVMALAQTSAGSVESSAGTIRIEQLASGLEYPWGLEALPGGAVLITEKPGRLRIYRDGKLSAPIEIKGVSYRSGANDQGGLMDVIADPDFARNNRIYLTFSEATPNLETGKVDQSEHRFSKPPDAADNLMRGGAAASAVLKDGALSDFKVIWRQTPKQVGRGHFGNRMAFSPDGKLFITSGERMRFDPAQDMAGNLGKVVRINPDGSIPKDNPFVGKSGAQDVFSLGHRNMLAIAFEPGSSALWVWEMGPLGGDEMNLVQAGKNYGWPVVSDGDNYDRSPIPDSATKQEFEKPVRTWTPVISPSGAVFYTGGLFPWKDSAIVGGLSAKGLIRLTMNNGAPVNEERIELGKRVRDIAVAPDGALLVITDDAKGELLRLMPQGKK